MTALYLVTGGAGFIGSHLVDALLGQGDRVRVLDNFSTGKRQNLAHALPWIELREGDIRDVYTVQEAMRGVEFVLHQAALPSVPRSVADPIGSNDVNVVGTLNVLIAARDAGVRRVVLASSSSVYGNSPTLPKREDMPVDPLSPYAVSKLAAERYGRAFYNVYELPTVALRYFNVFGPRQDPVSQYAAVIPRFVMALFRGIPAVIYGDGMQSRDFTYVGNVVRANLLACHSDRACGRVLNVACGEQHTLLDLYSELTRLVGRPVQPDFLPGRTGDVRDSLAAIDWAREMLGYEPRYSWSEGLQMTVNWYEQQVGVLAGRSH